MSKYEGEVVQVSFVLPAAIDKELKDRARRVAVDAGIDIVYTDIIVAAICRSCGLPLPSEPSAAASRFMGVSHV